MPARTLMVQGTGSDVGKSSLVAGLCRIAKRRGLNVAPFKPQNMSNNAAVCADGAEIGRAQALQARAAGLEPRSEFNPVLLKPTSDRRAQIVLNGRSLGDAEAARYMARRGALLAPVAAAFDTLAHAFEFVVVEGAGSPAEINLRAGDIANMGFARAVGAPVCLVGDIDRGGVIAALIGTHTVLEPADRELIATFVINKFRGDRALFGDGVAAIERWTGWPCSGVIPWLDAAAALPAEDAVSIGGGASCSPGALAIRAPMLSRIANFDDVDPLRAERDVDFAFVPPGQPIGRDADVILLLGSKSTLGDLAFLREQGWHHDILAHARAGGRVLGICAGFQMLGRKIRDLDAIDGEAGEAEGLGLLDLETEMRSPKITRAFDGVCALSGEAARGYEIHVGRVTGADTARPFARSGDLSDGARSADGRIEGVSAHGLFANDGFRRAWLTRAGGAADPELAFENRVERAIDAIADGLENALEIDRLFALARQPRERA